MQELFQRYKILIIFLGFIGLIIGLLWVNGEHGDPTGVRMTMIGKYRFWQAGFDLLQNSIPSEWENPEKTPPYYHIKAEVIQTGTVNCTYGSGFDFLPANRYRLDTQITITDKVSGEVIGNRLFEGHEPPPCEDVGSLRPAISGNLTGTGVIEDWIIETISEQSTLPPISEDRPERMGIYTTATDTVEDLPPTWFVGIDEYPRYRLDISKHTLKIGCDYSSLPGMTDRGITLVERNYVIVLMDLVDLENDLLIFRDVIIGSDPDECPDQASFNLRSNEREQIYGESPDRAEITARLEELLIWYVEEYES